MQGRIRFGGFAIGLCLAFATIAMADDFAPCGPFTDAQLTHLLQTKSRGVIYSWSPQMPLSVMGLPEAKRIAQELNIEFIPLYDPLAKPMIQFAEESCHPIAAKELKMLGVLNHYPSVLVFSQGRISSPLLPGYEEPPSLKTFIREHL